MSRRKRPGPFETDTDSDGGLSSSQTSSIHKRRRANDGSSIVSTPAPEDEPQSPATTPQSDEDLVSEPDDEEDEHGVEEGDRSPRRYISADDNEAVESGILESVHAVNFMCHENERWPIGPLINFICGKNGSGKSAILTAIQLCFGGKAAATGRGRKLEDYIRTGQKDASVTCYIKNRGSGAFKHDEYGDQIAVERHWHITAGGNCTAGFKIRNANGKVMASRKQDLDEIVEEFTLQFDNPLATLTQDDARTWIADTKPSRKYQLFLRGVLLEQLDTDYKLIGEQVDSMSPKLRQSKEDLDEKKRRREVAERKLKESEARDTQRDRLHELKHQCIWVQVVESENVRDALKGEVEKNDQSIAEEEAKQETHQTELDRLHQRYDDKKAEVVQAEDQVKEAKSAQADADAIVKEKVAAATATKAEIEHAKHAVKEAQRDLANKNKEIEAEEARLAEIDGGGAAQRRRELEDLKVAEKDAEDAIIAHRDKQADLRADEDNAKEQLDEAKKKHSEQFDEVKNCKAKLRDSQKAGSLPDTRFHRSMPQLIQALNRETRFRQKPIGPIGKHVTLLEPKFTYVIEKLCGGTLNAFVVTSKADQDLLMTIARKNNMPEVRVNIVPPGALDLSGKEPDEKYLTVLRALRIDNELITKLLVIAHHVESAILMADFNEAQELMNRPNPRDRAALVEQCYALAPGNHQKAYRLFYRGGNPAQDPVDTWTGALRMNANVEDQIRLHETRVQEAENLLSQYNDTMKTCERKVTEAKNALIRYAKETAQLKAAHQTAVTRREEKQGEIDQDDIAGGTLDSLRASLPDLEAKIVTQSTLYQDCVKADDSAKEEVRSARREAHDASKRTANLQNVTDALRSEVQQADQEKAAAIIVVNKCQNKINGLKNDKESYQQNLTHEEGQLAGLIQQAEAQGSARVPIPEGEDFDSLDKKFTALRAQLTRVETALGGSHLEIQAAATKAGDEFNLARKHFESMEKLQALLKSTLLIRQQNWKQLRSLIGARAKIKFINQLSQRGFRGKLIIDHNQHKLETKVEPDITQKDAGGRNAKTLSGGEKTFAQICLLLALWEAMGSPIRCLDEFDVFMDAINRSITIGMIQEAARQSQGKQYIMISPGSRSDITRAPDVHAFEVAPPERGQQRIDFQRVSAAA